MPRRKKERNCNKIKVECRCDNMNMRSWSLRNILNINVRHLCHTYSPFQYPPSIQTQRKGFHRVCYSLHFIPGLHAFCSPHSPTVSFYTLSVRPAFIPFDFFTARRVNSEISLLPHGEERSEPQDFELCSCFVLSLGNSLYSILILKPWAHALDLRSFYSSTKLKKWRHNKHTVFF